MRRRKSDPSVIAIARSVFKGRPVPATVSDWDWDGVAEVIAEEAVTNTVPPAPVDAGVEITLAIAEELLSARVVWVAVLEVEEVADELDEELVDAAEGLEELRVVQGCGGDDGGELRELQNLDGYMRQTRSATEMIAF